MKKVMMATSMLFGIMILFLSDPMQSVMFFIYAFMMYQQIYGKRKNAHWVLALSAIFAFINIYADSLPDVIFWILAGFANREVI